MDMGFEKGRTMEKKTQIRHGIVTFFVMMLLVCIVGCDQEMKKFEEATALRTEGKRQEAIQAYYGFMRKYPQSEKVAECRMWIQRLEEWSRIDETIARADKLREGKNYRSAMELYSEALTKSLQVDYHKADELRKVYEELKPQYRSQLITDAETALKGGNPYEAKKFFQEALKLTPPNEQSAIRKIVSEVITLINELETELNSRRTVERAKEIRRRQEQDEQTESSTPGEAFDWASLFDLGEDEGDAPPEIVYGDDEAPTKAQTKQKLKGLLKELK